MSFHAVPASIIVRPVEEGAYLRVFEPPYKNYFFFENLQSIQLYIKKLTKKKYFRTNHHHYFWKTSILPMDLRLKKEERSSGHGEEYQSKNVKNPKYYQKMQYESNPVHQSRWPAFGQRNIISTVR